MSNSDDTDLLLDIPPNFFSVPSDDSETSDRELSLSKSFRFKPKRQDKKKLVSDLMCNVSELANRISVLEDIEGSRYSSCGESHLPLGNSSFQNMHVFKGSTDSLSQHSFKSSSHHLGGSPPKSTRPQSLPPTPILNRYSHILEEFPKSHSLNTSPEKSKYLSKTIDSPLSRIKTSSNNQNNQNNVSESSCKRRLFSESDSHSITSAGNVLPKVDFKSCFTQSYLESKNAPHKNSLWFDANPVKHLDLPEVDRLLKEMELTEEEMENKSNSKDCLSSLPPRAETSCFLRRSHNNPLSDLNNETSLSKNKTHPEMLNMKQISNEFEGNLCSRETNCDFKKAVVPQNMAADNDFSDDSIRKSTRHFLSGTNSNDYSHSTAGGLTRGLYNVDSQNSIIEELKELDKKTQEIVANSMPHSQMNAGLCEPHLSRTLHSSDSLELLKQKLEEEYRRRQHCENLIIDLQQEVLEWRERLAVAVAIDAEKNRAIGKLETTWRRTVEHWRQLEDQRHNLAVALQTSKEERREEISELNKKVRRYELELSQALDLAAGYKLKADVAEKERASVMAVADKKNFELSAKLKDIEESNRNTQSKLLESEDKIQLLQDKLSWMEQNFSEENKLLQDSQERLGQLEAELSLAVAEKAKLLSKLKEENQLVANLKNQMEDLTATIDEKNKKEKKALEDLKTLQQNQDKLKKELRVFYQKQLESVVRDKLKEFQSQLDAAEAALKVELHTRERALAELAARQMQILTEKHKSELDKLKEETKEQQKSSEDTILELKESLELERSRRAEMARELHSVMETQWRQAINIITSQTNFPSKQEPTNEKGETTSSVHALEHGYMNQKTESKSMPDQLQKYFQMLLEKMPANKEDLNNSWLYSSFLSDDIATSAHQGEELNLNSNAKSEGNRNAKSKPPWK
nr:PREDICTED: myosin-2 heavy chain [Bemisia tabaci]